MTDDGGKGRSNPANLSRSTNQAGVKVYNERLVLSLIRSHGALSKVEVARLTGLSPQACSVIMNQLENDGLLQRGRPLRGKVGQPSVPMSLNPEGAFSVGFKFGRRSADLMLMDMVGTVRATARITYAFPEPEALMDFLTSGVTAFSDALTPAQYARVAGLGIAAPSEMWSWQDEFGAPQAVLDAWRHFDIAPAAHAATGWPVHCYNDATAACAAELAFGQGRRYPDFLYVFFATLVGGGVVLDGELYPGRRSYAGALGSMPVATPGGSRRLIQCSSLVLLERRIREAGGDPAALWTDPAVWVKYAPLVSEWIDHASDGLATAVCAAISVIDFPYVVVDGSFPDTVRSALVAHTRDKVGRMDMQGVAPVEIVAGSVGNDARVLGAASLPLLAGYARDTDVLFG